VFNASLSLAFRIYSDDITLLSYPTEIVGYDHERIEWACV